MTLSELQQMIESRSLEEEFDEQDDEVSDEEIDLATDLSSAVSILEDILELMERIMKSKKTMEVMHKPHVKGLKKLGVEARAFLVEMGEKGYGELLEE